MLFFIWRTSHFTSSAQNNIQTDQFLLYKYPNGDWQHCTTNKYAFYFIGRIKHDGGRKVWYYAAKTVFSAWWRYHTHSVVQYYCFIQKNPNEKQKNIVKRVNGILCFFGDFCFRFLCFSFVVFVLHVKQRIKNLENLYVVHFFVFLRYTHIFRFILVFVCQRKNVDFFFWIVIVL